MSALGDIYFMKIHLLYVLYVSPKTKHFPMYISELRKCFINNRPIERYRVYADYINIYILKCHGNLLSLHF